ncbi:sensor histidine kinase [Telluribacter sp.]|jgi:two-component sensor histidine kinase|uniref:sensor histidine kinase n=1 Tax=Telluribacter sp. TaxID=1978767 RepID=UPI002E123194|nr:histidine kinase [Telluribacter sp.]
MIAALKRPDTIRIIEFWISTFVYVSLLATVFTADTARDTLQPLFKEAGLPFDYYEHYFFPKIISYTTLYLSFFVLNFWIVPRIFQREEVLHQAFFVFLIFIVTGFILGVAGTYTRYYLYGTYSTDEEVYSIVFRDSYGIALFFVFMVGIYSFLKYLGLLLLNDTDTIPPKYRTVTKDSLGSMVVWFISIFLLLIVEAEGFLILAWGALIPSGLIVYCLAFFRFIPASLGKTRPFLSYLLRIVPALVLLIPTLFITLTLIGDDPEASSGTAFFIVACHLFITVPLSWVLFKRYTKGNQELFVLQKELGQTHANFDFLRSQINPHFLFNALNTIYGTAIQEKAERTSEGIEKLGDMMRFMLQENMQEKIPLAREIEYLDNYISLQQLRTDPNPGIRVQTEIEPPLEPVQIAPMLLIPFVENAFKHGISLREPSHIVISLEVQEKTLYFDVHNSRHLKSGIDPERNSNGIGLANVRQRLQLLYPQRHELMIRETGKEFFVHLKIQL